MHQIGIILAIFVLVWIVQAIISYGWLAIAGIVGLIILIAWGASRP